MFFILNNYLQQHCVIITIESETKMDRKAIANETMRIIEQGWYEYNKQRVEIAGAQHSSLKGSVLISPEEELKTPGFGTGNPLIKVENVSTVEAILRLRREGAMHLGVLNFASAKNPGGGFLNGAMAQEESLAASSGLYQTQRAHPEYYQCNRDCGTMSYTDYAIYSPDVVFFRNAKFSLLPQPVTASVLTLPAVNMGQVLLKGEDEALARRIMKNRMRRALEIFADKGDRVLILGAYGCGVFRNDPAEISRYWTELLSEGFGGCFDSVFHAVLDRSKSLSCINAFLQSQG